MKMISIQLQMRSSERQTEGCSTRKLSTGAGE